MSNKSGISGAFSGSGLFLGLLRSAMSAVAQIQPVPAFTAAQLKGKWRTHLEGSGLGAQHSVQGQPIVHAGVIYIRTGASDVFSAHAQ